MSVVGTDTERVKTKYVCVSVKCMPTGKDRVERMREILSFLKENKGEATLGELYGSMAMKYGTTRKTFWDYLESLKLAGEIEMNMMYRIGQEGQIPIRLIGKKNDSK